MKIKLLLLYFLCIMMVFAQAQSGIRLSVQLDKDNWKYQLGQEAIFTIQLLDNGVPLEGVEVSYKLGMEKMKPTSTGQQKSSKESITLKGKATAPGFLRCEARAEINGKVYKALATAAYDPLSIKATQTQPADFWDFWHTAVAAAKAVPLDPKLRLLSDRSTDKTNVYEVSFQNEKKGSRIYGILCVPKKPGSYPAVLQVPGAGIRAYQGAISLADKGMITLQIGIHGVPVTYPDSLYSNLFGASLKDYYFFNLDNRDQYYYKRVYLGCVKAVEYLTSLTEYDGENLLVWGGSQGGGLSLVTTALDKRVKYLICNYPALCDFTGYLHDRAGGWPHLFAPDKISYLGTAEKIKTAAYFDAVNFARAIKVPGYYAWGYNDEVVPPTSMYAAYNLIDAPKELLVAPETGHRLTAGQQVQVEAWLMKTLGIE